MALRASPSPAGLPATEPAAAEAAARDPGLVPGGPGWAPSQRWQLSDSVERADRRARRRTLSRRNEVPRLQSLTEHRRRIRD